MRMFVLFLFVMIFNIYDVYGDTVYIENVGNGCSHIATMTALFEPNVHVCATGYYLPANTDICEICPSWAVCDGGIYTFNENINQGILIKAKVNNGCGKILPVLTPIFELNEHNCSAGYYMPMNYDGCVVCPANSYCSGGTYMFNKIIDQGIESCPNNWYSPMGMSSVAQCGRILHVGEDIVYLRNVKKTTPSLNIKVGDDIFYGNMTVNDVYMHNGAMHKLKIRFNDTTYSVYDDTVEP